MKRSSQGLLRSRRARVGLVIVVGVVLVAGVAPVIAPYAPSRQDLSATQLGTSSLHWLGTDALGRDVFSRVLVGTRVAVAVGFGAAGLGLCLGVVLGLVAGVAGGWFDLVSMRAADLALAFPFLVAALFLVGVLGRSSATVVLIIGALSWPAVARLTRGAVVGVRHAHFVTAARLAGVPWHRVVRDHILPHALGPVLAYSAVSVPAAIGAQAALSYLGVAARPGQPDWGQMIAEGQKYFGFHDQLWLAPSVALVITTLGFVLLSDGVGQTLQKTAP